MTIRVLLIEDNDDDAALAKRHLLNWGRHAGLSINVVRAEDLDAAFKEIAAERFDYIFTDLAVPPHSGTEIIALLRPTTGITPIIVYSGHLESDQINRAIDAGASQFLPKSADRDTMGAAMASAKRISHTDETLDAISKQVSELSAAVSQIKHEPIQPAEIKQIAQAVAKEAVSETFRSLGIDPSDHRDMRETHNDLAWLREFRKSLLTMTSKVGMTVVTLVIVAAAGALWLGVKSNIIGK